MAHETEICSVDLQHVVELLSLRFGPFAAPDGIKGWIFVDMFICFSG